MKRARVIPAILLLVILTGCTASPGVPAVSDLQRVTTVLNDEILATGAFQSVFMDAYVNNLITKETAKAMWELSDKVQLANKEAISVTRSISKLDSPSKAQILKIMQPIIASFGNLAQSGVLGIKNEQTKIKVQGIIVTIQAGLSTLQVILAATGGN